ncbi:FliM/FliN family flagellar motor switch protein (plasmid) [Pantoea sp. BJ2]|uniref:Surface presentation of antigens protein SpaO n=1 Tax=Pantoea sp. BJ2 TaxID=3141322 RepID=A0AAU7U315_9GAMM
MNVIPLRRYDGVESKLKFGLGHFIAEAYVSPHSAIPPGAVAEVFSDANGLSVIVDLRSWMQKEWLTASGLSSEKLSAGDIRDCFHYSDSVCVVNIDEQSTVKLQDHHPADESVFLRDNLPQIATSLGTGWILALPDTRISADDNIESLFPDLTFNLRLVLGESKLKLKHIKTLNVEDVLLISTLREDIVCDEKIIGKYFSEGDEFMTSSLYEDMNEFDDLTDITKVSEPYNQRGIDNLKVNLEFIVHQKQVSLKELLKLAPGEALGIGTGGLKSVSIHANGALLGKGELVWLEGQMGVEIQELYSGVSDGE